MIVVSFGVSSGVLPLPLQIENYLYRNHETRKYQQEQAYRLQQGIVTSTTQQVRAAKQLCGPGQLSDSLLLTLAFSRQMIDRICVKVQDHLNSLRNSETDAILEDVRAAENLIKDARNSKTVRSEGHAARQPTVFHFAKEADSFSVNRFSTPCIHPAAPQPLPPGLCRQGGGEQLVCGAHSGETGVRGWRGDHRHGPAAAGEKIRTTTLRMHQCQ